MMRPFLHSQIRAPNPMPRLKRLIAFLRCHRMLLLQRLVAFRRLSSALRRQRILERFAYAVEGRAVGVVCEGQDTKQQDE